MLDFEARIALCSPVLAGNWWLMVMETINVQILVSKERLGKSCWKSEGLGNLVVCINPKLNLNYLVDPWDWLMAPHPTKSTLFRQVGMMLWGCCRMGVCPPLKQTCRAFLVILVEFCGHFLVRFCAPAPLFPVEGVKSSGEAELCPVASMTNPLKTQDIDI